MLNLSIMKIDRRGFLAASASALLLAKSQLSSAAHAQPSETSEPLEVEGKIEGREIAISRRDSTHALPGSNKLWRRQRRLRLQSAG